MNSPPSPNVSVIRLGGAEHRQGVFCCAPIIGLQDDPRETMHSNGGLPDSMRQTSGTFSRPGRSSILTREASIAGSGWGFRAKRNAARILRIFEPRTFDRMQEKKSESVRTVRLPPFRTRTSQRVMIRPLRLSISMVGTREAVFVPKDAVGRQFEPRQTLLSRPRFPYQSCPFLDFCFGHLPFQGHGMSFLDTYVDRERDFVFSVLRLRRAAFSRCGPFAS